MRCSRVQYLYEEYVVGAIEPETMDRIDKHIASCAPCREFYESNDDLAQLLTGGSEIIHPGEPYMASLAGKVMAALSAPAGVGAAAAPLDPEPVRCVCAFQEFKPWRRPLWWSGAAAAVALLAVGVMSPRDDAALYARLPDALEEPPAAPRDVASNMFPNFGVPSGLAPTAVSASGNQLNPTRGVGDSSDGQIDKSARDARAALDGQRRAFSQRSSDADAMDVDSRTVIFSFMAPGANAGRLPSARRSSEPVRMNLNLPSQMVEEILALDAMRTEESRAKLARIVASLRDNPARMDPRAKSDPALVDQWNLYRQAMARLGAGDIEGARGGFERALTVSADTRLATRARFQLAELHFDHRGDFERAREYYRKCAEAKDPEALNEEETQRVAGRIRALDHYAFKQWKPLALLHQIHNSPWDEAVSALNEASAASEAPALMPVAARHITERLAKGDDPSPKSAAKLAEALRAACGRLESSPSAGAWINLALGETLLKCQDASEEASRAYRRALELEPASPASVVARERLEQLRARPRRASSR